mmetsp:Transcript_7859/g.11606  ORF Transcript_7859/g.11606 Transcript_7859/m.11606 type:complete len:540 (+) Transcript_7859:150-1769(+)|eukprot:CAMPEP_0196813792 /NCGR_PEP_ID=MMETSP1362-20130617/39294_1 /TAXON_ID=163516 /ORGANISM="Leptocylindrus danicus, Strain CCMP1856" /LENGTH=539 /DNA_ID=CAMNT_0042190179 /DNA_START=148 /DNA_END=1767 /DNA_ORIENTATION=-
MQCLSIIAAVILSDAVRCNAFASFTVIEVAGNARQQYSSFDGSRLFSSSASVDAAEALNKALNENPQIKNVKCRVSSSNVHRFGLIATENVRKGDAVISIPNDFCLTADKARQVYTDMGFMSDKYDGWTGDLGLIALLILRERAKLAEDYSDSYISKEDSSKRELFAEWAATLPSMEEMMGEHPLLWVEDDQEELQSSSTKKIYRLLDDVEEDASWLEDKMWSKDRSLFPEEDVDQQPCFTLGGFKWALSIANSRCVFVDGSLKLAPIIDFSNHNDFETVEVTGGFFGTFGTTAGVQVKADKNYKEGDEIFVSYGPKSAAEYLLEHGFMPDSTKTTAVAELTFEVDENDRFFDDKADVLEFETGGAPIEPVQAFDVVAAPGKDGQPDPALMQFLRLVKLGNTDAFLLESIFRKEVWGFMAYPVSEKNEREVIDAIISSCTDALKEMNEINDEATDGVNSKDEAISKNKRACATLRCIERRALQRTLEYVQREEEALDLKEYYQERRLKDLGLDSPWEGDENNPDVGWGARKPGDGGLDW